MEKKSNSLSRVKRRQQEKVLRFSIRKYSFGAASVAVAALMFLGARVVSADSVTPVEQPHVGASIQGTSSLESQDKEEPTSSVKVDTAVASQLVTQLKDQLHVKETANTDLLVRAKEELVKAEQTLANSKVSQEEVDALVARLTNVLDQLRAVEIPQVKADKNDESTQEVTSEIKPEVAKPTSEISAKSEETSENTNAEQLEKAKASLKLSIDRLEQTIAQTPENDLTREILEKAIAQVAVAKSAFGGVEVSLRDVEDMNRVIKRNESSVMIARNRLTSGSHDPRNGQSMGEGTQFRAYTATSSSGALKNVRYFASVDKKTNGGSNTRNDDPEFTEKKTVIKAKYEQNSSGKWMVYDVYFNNNGVSMAEKSYSQHYYFQPPFNIMDGSNKVENLTFTRYQNLDQNPNRKLSDGGSGFQKVGDTLVISNPWEQKTRVFPGDRRSTYDPQGVSRADQKWQVFKNNQNDPYLDKIVRKTDGNYTGGVSYTLGLEVGKENLDYAIHMTARVKLKDNVTETEAANGNVYAASNTTGRTTNQSYIVGSQGTSLQNEPDAPKDPIKGLTVTKTVGDDAGDPINPVSSGYVKHGKDGTFPSGMSWSWKDNKSPNTDVAGVFKYKSIATYKDGTSSEDKNSGSDGTVTLIVKPKKPTITTSVENKKGLTGQQITVNVGSGVPNGSTVNLYDGDTVIGTGTTNGETATVTVTGALPGKPITAATVVNNGGTVTSDKSEPVTPTEAPDNQPPKIYWLKEDGSRQELGSTHAAGQNVVIPLYRGDAVNTRLITVDDSGKVTDFRLENLQSGFNFTPVSGTATEESPLGQNVTGKVGLEVKKGKYTARAISTDGTNSTTGYFVFDIHEQAEKYPLEGKTETVTVGDSLKTWNGRVDSNQYTEAPKGRGVGVEWGWKGEAPKVVQDTAGVFKYTATATHPDKSVAESNPQVTIIVKPKAPTIETDLTGKAEVPNTEVVVNVHEGVKDGSTVTLYSPEGRAIGTGTVTNGKAKITGTIPVGNITAKTTVQTPGQPNVESELSPIKVATKIAETEKPGKIEITQQPNGNAIVTPKKPDGSTYPPKTKVEIPGENGTTITVTIGDNGSGEVPNDKLPKTNVPGTGTVTEPNKKPSQPVDVTTPARKTPTIELKPDPKTGDVTVTPQRPGGGTYPPGTTVEIPGEDGPITVEIGQDGKGKVPNDKLPKKDVPGTGKITEPGKPAVEVPNVTTPAKVTPETPETEKPGKIEITQQPNGNAIVTPKKPDGSTYPPKTTVEIPGENGTTIPVTIGDNGSGEVPNDNLPKTNVPGTGTVTEPNKKPSQPVDVTTPARKTPTIELKPDPKTGDVTVTPQRPGGGTYPPGTTVEIPGEDGPITVEIGQDGKGKVPNDKLPKKDVPGTGKITEPGKPAVEVPEVTTPAKVTPETPETEKPGKIEITQQPNGNVIVTPKKPDGSTYPSGSKVVIPGENNTPIEVTIGDNGSGEVPNDKLPKKDVPGTGTVTEPNKKPSQPVDVTTPARKTPTVELDKDPKTGDVTVTPQRPGGGTYPPGTTVEIPGEDGPITVEIGQDGKGKVPNDKLPKKDVPGTGKITEPGQPTVEVPVTTPSQKTPTLDVEQDPKTGEVTVTPKKPDGSTFPPGTKVEIPGKDGNPITVTIGEDGKGKVPNSDLPEGDVPGTGKITEPGKPAVEVPVTTPGNVTPNTPRTEKPGKIEITRKPNGDAVVTPKKPDGSTYPSGSKVVIPGENNTPITVTIGDNGSGEVPNDKLPKKDVPGTGTVTEPNKKPSQPVDVTTPGQKTPTVDVEQDPKTGDVTVTPQRPGGGTYPPGTKVEIPGEDGPITVEIGQDGKGKVPNDKLPKKDVPGTGTVTEPNKKPSQPVDVITPARKTPTVELDKDPKTGDVTVTPKKPDGSTFPPGTKVEIPGENGNPIEVTIGEDGKGKVPNDNLPKTDIPGTGKITEPGKPSVEVPVTTPSQKTPTLDVEQDPKTGEVTVTPKKPDGSTFQPGTKVEIPGKDGNPITVTIGEDGKGKVPNDKLPKKDVPGTGKITEPGKPAVEVPVTTPGKVTPNTPTTETPSEIEITRKPNGNAIVTPKKPDGSTYPSGSKVVIPGENNTPIEVTIGDNGSGEVPNDKLPKKDVPGTGTVTEPNKKPSQPVDVTTPARKTPTVDVEQDPKTGDVTVTPKKPDGSTFPPGTKVEIPGEDGPITVTIGEDGKGKVPNDKLPKKDVPGTGKITEPGKPAVEVPVTTPGKVTPNTPTTETPSEIEITRKPNGNAIVTPKKPDGSTYPSGSKVVIPGENNTPIEVTIGDNGSGEVPNDNLPKKDVPGTGTVTEPNKKPSQPVDVTTPARKTPTVDVEQDPKTGDVTVTPKKPDGSTFPPGTTVEIPGKDGNPITVTIGEDGKGKVPNSELPDGKVPGTGKITEPGKPAVEVPVTTPGKVTPNTPTTERPSEIEITRKPNGDAIVTPKKPDGTTYPSGSKVVIPGENNTPIEVTIGDNGSGEVPNDKLPKKDVPGTGTVTEPNKKPSQPVDVTTPARKTPTVDVEQDPKTGDVTVTPKKPDGSTFPPGTKVEIPGKDGPITVTIGEDGKGKVPNSDLPEGKVSGPGKITEPNKPAVEVPVTTPAKVTPETPTTEKPVAIEITRKPNGDAIVTPKKPDGSTYPSGSKVVIPGENGTTITVTIGDNGSGEVPNDNLPKKDVPGTGKVTEPNKKPSQPVDVTTPARKTPTVDVEQDPKTGDVTVTPKKPDGSTYPPGTKVEIPGKDGNPITVTIGEDGKGKVPNSDLPDGKVPGTAKITEPGQPTVEVPVETPAKVTPATPTTETPSEIEITRKPNGDAVVTPKKPDGSTYPPGTKVEIPGENGTPITVTIGDNGSGEVPNDNLPKKDVPGTGKVTEPNKKPSQPVDVTTPARKTPTVDVEQDPKTGDVTVTPKKPDGSTYPPGTKVEIPGKDGNPITVTIGEDGKGKVPNSDLPDGKVPGTAKITEPGQPTVEVPVETPAKVTPATPTTETPSEIEITRKPNGDAVVTPKKPDGSTYPPGTKVEIPGENGTPITVTIGDNGSGEVPNDNLPKKDVPGTGKVTEPNKKPSQPVDVTTPARKTPTVDVEQDPKTGDVTVTPKKPDGSTYPPGTKVEIPGKDGNPITVTIGEDGKGKVPNSDLPDGKVPGTAKITEPGQPTVEVPVETPAKVTPVAVNPNVDHGDTTATNNNGAKSNDSQKVLPNTGTESNATLASLGLLGILGGLGLALGKKKED